MSLNELERAGLAAARERTTKTSQVDQANPAAWIEFGLSLLMESGRRVRAARLAPLDDVNFKGDGSPVTNLETAVEEAIATRLRSFAPEAVLVGEETGGSLPGTGLALAVDPVDGTWAFVSRTENIATTLAVFRDGNPFLGMVSNPATGEIAYATENGQTRIVQLSIFGEGDSAQSLPLSRSDGVAVLVNIHPGRSSGPVIARLYDAWSAGEVRMVRSPGGSPAWALLEAAKGSFVYANLWSKRPAEAFDLAAGCLLVQGAGGAVTDLDGSPINPASHAGPFIATVDEESRRIVTKHVRAVIDKGPG